MLVSPTRGTQPSRPWQLCSLSTWPEVHDFSIASLADGRTLVHIHDDSLSFYPVRWSPDGTELLYQTYEMTTPESGCKDKLAGSERWWVIGVDGAPARSVSDPLAVMRQWYGNEYVEYRCLGKPVLDPACVDEEQQSAPVEIYVDGALVTTSANGSFQVVGFLPGEPAPTATP